MSRRIAVIGAVLESPQESQSRFNEVVASYKGIVRGRMGIPFDDQDMSVISLTVLGTLDDINALTGKLGNIPGISVKTAMSGRDLAD